MVDVDSKGTWFTCQATASSHLLVVGGASSEKPSWSGVSRVVTVLSDCLHRRSNASVYGILGPILCDVSHLACFRNPYAWKMWWLQALEWASQMLPPPSSSPPHPHPACSPAPLSELLSNKDSQMPARIFSKLPFRFPTSIYPGHLPANVMVLGGSLRKLLRVQTLPGCIFMGAQKWAQNASCDQLWKCPHL